MKMVLNATLFDLSLEHPDEDLHPRLLLFQPLALRMRLTHPLLALAQLLGGRRGCGGPTKGVDCVSPTIQPFKSYKCPFPFMSENIWSL